MKTALYQQKTDSGKVQCTLCPHMCTIADGSPGLCRIRTAVDGTLFAASYGLLSSMHLDPIEKKPLYHFHPGTMILSIGGWGCNFACAFCQNWTISQQVMETGERCSPEDIIEDARSSGSKGIAYTYNEPLVSYEFVKDCAELAASRGLKNVLVTNGYINSEPAAALLPLVHALNIDIKSMDDDFYKKNCRGSLQPVLDFAVQAHEAECHVEITNLVIPTLNDDEEVLEELAQWIRARLGRQTPLHLSAYRPQYKMDIQATPTKTLIRAHEICSSTLDYVYLGNVLTDTGRDTTCPACGHLMISRQGYSTGIRGIANGKCAKCGQSADIIAG